MQISPASIPDPDIVKCFSGMTAFTTLTKPAKVHVIILMTLVTGTGQIQLAFDRLTVTGVAVELFVRPVELEVRLLVVIEPPHFP